MNLIKTLIVFAIFTFLVNCSKSDNYDKSSAYLINKKLQEKLNAYIKLYQYYPQDYQFQNEILDGLAHNDPNIIKRIEEEIRIKNYIIEMDSIFSFYMDEPALSKLKSKRNYEIYRLQISEQLKSQIEIIRVDNSYNLIYKKYYIDDTCNPITTNRNWEKSCFKIMAQINKKINESEWKEFKEIMQGINFWSISSYELLPHCMDGSNWELEGSWGYNYNRIKVSCPGEYDLIKISGNKLFEFIKNDR